MQACVSGGARPSRAGHVPGPTLRHARPSAFPSSARAGAERQWAAGGQHTEEVSAACLLALLACLSSTPRCRARALAPRPHPASPSPPLHPAPQPTRPPAHQGRLPPAARRPGAGSGRGCCIQAAEQQGTLNAAARCASPPAARACPPLAPPPPVAATPRPPLPPPLCRARLNLPPPYWPALSPARLFTHPALPAPMCVRVCACLTPRRPVPTGRL